MSRTGVRVGPYRLYWYWRPTYWQVNLGRGYRQCIYVNLGPLQVVYDG